MSENGKNLRAKREEGERKEKGRWSREEEGVIREEEGGRTVEGFGRRVNR